MSNADEKQPVNPTAAVPVTDQIADAVALATSGEHDGSLDKYELVEVIGADGTRQQMTKEQAANELARLKSLQGQLEAGTK